MTLVSELHQDHVNLNKLLEILDKKVIKLKAGSRPNFNLMADVVGYIAKYAEGYHHPREDKMYAFFKGRSNELDDVMSQCEDQHRVLKGSTQTLLNTIDGILHDAVVPMNDLIEQLAAFVINEKVHINFEETEIFPVLDHVATNADWEKVEKELPVESDPLFGEKQAEEYKALYVELMRDINS
ncbi:hemerythrin domain-containing protein [Neptunomonas antarctica]|uniref:Hemerythrin-like domain-containing protein n=1 Tax=Neptunomonas antarctica TaxID=619304 RepID=A0A1N7KCF1_9GAMM|nr:hemerythrin domain-containing protein [Neptunomonas antarctica]SIS59180.1 Hemerythrin-like domain-containing protein [Neptunomonas antarctica]